MPQDKYTATWVSHSSISDFLRCPRAYYLKNVYKDPSTGHKFTLMSPPLALGQCVHEVIESLSVLPTDRRFKESLISKFDTVWEKITGKKGGFVDSDTENSYKKRGKEMLERVMKNPGPLQNLAVKIKMSLPNYWLSDEDNIILCGKIDWLEYLKDDDSVHIIDFKTGKKDESSDSLQLPIYHLLATNTQTRPVSKASYWYISRQDAPVEQNLPDLNKAFEDVLNIAKQIKLARSLNRFKCPHKTGCGACRPLEQVIRGQAEQVGIDGFKRDIYILPSYSSDEETSVIL